MKGSSVLSFKEEGEQRFLSLLMIRIIFGSLFSFLILIQGCSYNTESSVRRFPIDTRDILNINLPYRPARTAFSVIDNILFVMQSEGNLIHIYRDGERINTIGGLGFGEANFNRLSDITVSPHGKLLTLDSFQRQIKAFDRNGMWLENYALININEPILFDVAHDGSVYIYDRTSNEIIIMDDKIENIVYRFGKFLFRDPVQLRSTFTHVTVYDKGTQKSYFFDNFGNFIETLDGYWQIDRFGNKYQLTASKVSYPIAERDFLFSLNPWETFSLKTGIISLISDRQIRISEIIYERN